MTAWLVTHGTRAEIIDADDADDARWQWINAHRPDWWGEVRGRVGLWGRVYVPTSRSMFDPYTDLNVRAADDADRARIADLLAEAAQYAGKRGWR